MSTNLPIEPMFETTHLLSKTPCSGGFTHLRLAAKNIASRAKPGQWIRWGEIDLHIMRSDHKAGWIELLFREDTPLDRSIEGPIGEPLIAPSPPARLLLTAGTRQLPSLIFMADRLRQNSGHGALLLLQADEPLPFRPTPCRTMVPGMPAGVIATLPLLSEWGIALRIASREALAGCFEGDVEHLAKLWLGEQPSVGEIKYLDLRTL